MKNAQLYSSSAYYLAQMLSGTEISLMNNLIQLKIKLFSA